MDSYIASDEFQLLLLNLLMLIIMLGSALVSWAYPVYCFFWLNSNRWLSMPLSLPGIAIIAYMFVAVVLVSTGQMAPQNNRFTFQFMSDVIIQNLIIIALAGLGHWLSYRFPRCKAVPA